VNQLNQDNSKIKVLIYRYLLLIEYNQNNNKNHPKIKYINNLNNLELLFLILRINL
jgi:hypothetical protein